MRLVLCDNKNLGCRSFQTGDQTPRVAPRHVNTPKSSKGFGVFSYRGLEYALIPNGKRVVSVLLSCLGSPQTIEWTDGGKHRTDFSSVYWAHVNSHRFFKYHIGLKHVIRVNGKPMLGEKKTVCAS